MSVEPPTEWSRLAGVDQPAERLACRLCGGRDRDVVLDLGVSPLSNKLVDPTRRRHAEPFFPLSLLVCRDCRLVQVDEFVSPADLFGEYVYFSSYSDLWLAHARAYADSVIPRFSLGPGTMVVELGSNDGYLLQYFAARGVPVLGIEPAANVAAKAVEKGIPTLPEFFGVDTARRLLTEGQAADLLVANNVLAHVPDLNGFVEGVRILLKPTGVATFEFSHVLRMIQGNQFDSIYHEHFCYFSLRVAQRAFASHGLSIFDVEELPTHGGSLRVFVAPERTVRAVTERVTRVLSEEAAAGLDTVDCYRGFAARVKEAKRDLLAFLIGVRRAGKSVVGYGAAAKGNTLLNYCGIRTDFLDYVADRSPHKQGLLLPGTGIPVVAPDRILETRPDYVLLLAWNLVEEVTRQLEAVGSWGGRFVVPLPATKVLD